jgi:hypothetical protein
MAKMTVPCAPEDLLRELRRLYQQLNRVPGRDRPTPNRVGTTSATYAAIATQIQVLAVRYRTMARETR